MLCRVWPPDFAQPTKSVWMNCLLMWITLRVNCAVSYPSAVRLKVKSWLIWSAIFSPQSFEIGWGSLCLTNPNQYENYSRANCRPYKRRGTREVHNRWKCNELLCDHTPNRVGFACRRQLEDFQAQVCEYAWCLYEDLRRVESICVWQDNQKVLIFKWAWTMPIWVRIINQLNELHYEKRSKRNESGKGVEHL